MAKFTQQAIMICLLNLLQEKSIDKITVKDICEKCDINRNTFYYYYSDIYQVLEALFKSETEKSLSDNCKMDSLYDDAMKRYYLIVDNKKAVWHLYNSKSKDIVIQYFYTITEHFIEKYVEDEARGYNLTEDDIKFVTDFYTNSIMGDTIKWLHQGMKEDSSTLIYRLTNAFHATIKALISSIHEENLKNQ